MSNSGPNRAPLPATVILLGWVSFFADISSEMIYPLLPLFVVGVLQSSTTDLGWIEGLAAACVAFLTAISGKRSDARRGGLARRTPWVRWGYGLPVLGKAVITVAGAWPIVLLGRLIDRTGKGFRGSPRDALISEAAPVEMRGRAFGFHRKMDTLGATVGVLISAALLWFLTGMPRLTASTEHLANPSQAGAFRIVFGVAAIMGLASLGVAALVKESPAHAPEPSANPAEAEKPKLPRTFYLAVAVLALFAVANSSDTFILLRGDKAGLSPWAVVLAYAFYNFVYALVSEPAGTMSDKLGRRRVIVVGWIIYALVYAGFASLKDGNMLLLWVLFGFYGVYIALTDGVSKALAADLTPKAIRGTGLGLFYMVTGLAALVGSVLTGWLWSAFGARVAFWVGAITALVAAACAAFLLPSATSAKSG